MWFGSQIYSTNTRFEMKSEHKQANRLGSLKPDHYRIKRLRTVIQKSHCLKKRVNNGMTKYKISLDYYFVTCGRTVIYKACLVKF
jgi:hypothetical protein